MNALEDGAAQWRAVGEFFDRLGATMDRIPQAGAQDPLALDEDAESTLA